VVFDPLTSYFLGVVGFGEPLPVPGTALALGAFGMTLLVAGVVLLARSPLLRPAPARTSGGGPGRPAAGDDAPEGLPGPVTEQPLGPQRFRPC
jgi:hypothetical protein